MFSAADKNVKERITYIIIKMKLVLVYFKIINNLCFKVISGYRRVQIHKA